MSITRPTYMEINLENLDFNIKEIKKKVGKNIEVMPVLKANGYGTHINKNLNILNKFNIVAVANVDEAIEIRKTGYKKNIFVLNQPSNDEISKIIKYNIIVGICSYEFIKKASSMKSKIIVHLELETGMGRTGINIDSIEEFIRKIPNNVVVEGIYTHFSSADYDYDYTNMQLKKFNEGVLRAKKILSSIKYVHAASSNGILNFPNSHFNMVRPGIILYGYESSKDTYNKINLKPVASLKSKIIFLKELNKNEKISYGGTYITNKKTKVATIPIGYADGYRRCLSNDFYVIINEKKAPIIGNICMDSFMVDVTEIKDVKIGDEVILFDNENIKLEDIADKCGTINYEILCTISSRVPRKNI